MPTPSAERSGEPEPIPKVPWGVTEIASGVVVALLGIVLFIFGTALVREAGFFSAPYLFASLIVGYAGMIAIAWLFGPRRAGGGFQLLGWKRPPRIGRAILWVTLAYLGLLALTIAYGYLLVALLGRNPLEEVNARIPELFGPGLVGILLTVAVVVIVGPLAEEIFFRGFVFQGFAATFGARAATLTSAVIFALFHFNGYVFIPILAIGLALAYLFQREGGLAAPFALHALNNGVSILLVYLNS